MKMLSPTVTTKRARLAAIVTGTACAIAAIWHIAAPTRVAAQSAEQQATMHPAEFALRAWLAPIDDRIVVRDGPGKNDVWLFSKLSFEQAAERARQAISGRKELPGGVRVQHWTYMEPTRSYFLTLGGAAQVRAVLSRHLDGSLVIIPEIGREQEAPKWTPPYRPFPIDLPHGPVR